MLGLKEKRIDPITGPMRLIKLLASNVDGAGLCPVSIIRGPLARTGRAARSTIANDCRPEAGE